MKSLVFVTCNYFAFMLRSGLIFSLSTVLWHLVIKWQTYSKLIFPLPLQFNCSVVSDSATPWTAAHQASQPIANFWSLLKIMSIELGRPSSHLILCHPLLLPSIFPSIGVFSNELALCIRWPKYWSFSIGPSKEDSGLISFRVDCFDLFAALGLS